MPSNLLASHLSAGSGPRFPSTASAPCVKHETHEKADPTPASGEALADRGLDYPASVEDAAALCGSQTFPCIACGACCRNLKHSPFYADLERGDGTCRHLDIRTNLCRIYETRPKICRVTEMFEVFNDRLTWEEYVDLNLQSCHELRSITYTPKLGPVNTKE